MKKRVGKKRKPETPHETQFEAFARDDAIWQHLGSRGLPPSATGNPQDSLALGIAARVGPLIEIGILDQKEASNSHGTGCDSTRELARAGTSCWSRGVGLGSRLNNDCRRRRLDQRGGAGNTAVAEARAR